MTICKVCFFGAQWPLVSASQPAPPCPGCALSREAEGEKGPNLAWVTTTVPALWGEAGRLWREGRSNSLVLFIELPVYATYSVTFTLSLYFIYIFIPLFFIYIYSSILYLYMYISYPSIPQQPWQGDGVTLVSQVENSSSERVTHLSEVTQLITVIRGSGIWRLWWGVPNHSLGCPSSAPVCSASCSPILEGGVKRQMAWTILRKKAFLWLFPTLTSQGS